MPSFPDDPFTSVLPYFVPLRLLFPLRYYGEQRASRFVPDALEATYNSPQQCTPYYILEFCLADEQGTIDFLMNPYKSSSHTQLLSLCHALPSLRGQALGLYAHHLHCIEVPDLKDVKAQGSIDGQCRVILRGAIIEYSLAA